MAYHENTSQALSLSDIKANAAEPSVFSTDLKPIFAKPVKLYTQKNAKSLGGLTKANIQLDLVDVAVEKDGSLETPKSWLQGGWFINSARPSEVGNMVINAHYDDNYGRPAGFWELKNIRLGDIVFVQDSLSRVYPYKVTQVFYLSIYDPNRLKILASEEGKSTVTLITCGGVWIPGHRTYSDRLVVKGELVNDGHALLQQD